MHHWDHERRLKTGPKKIIFQLQKMDLFVGYLRLGMPWSMFYFKSIPAKNGLSNCWSWGVHQGSPSWWKTSKLSAFPTTMVVRVDQRFR